MECTCRRPQRSGAACSCARRRGHELSIIVFGTCTHKAHEAQDWVPGQGALKHHDASPCAARNSSGCSEYSGWGHQQWVPRHGLWGEGRPLQVAPCISPCDLPLSQVQRKRQAACSAAVRAADQCSHRASCSSSLITRTDEQHASATPRAQVRVCLSCNIQCTAKRQQR
jgi:hypothetical protein